MSTCNRLRGSTSPSSGSGRAGRPSTRSMVCGPARQIVQHGGVALAVSLNIANAFNTLPWDMIGAGLRAHLSRVIRDYFMETSISCRDAELVRSGGPSCAVFRRGPFWACCCGTSRTMRYWGGSFPPAAMSSVTRMTRWW